MAAQVNNDKDLKILQWNCYSIRKKITEFKKHTENYDIIALQETWLSRNDNIRYEPFEIIRKDRIGRPGGGIMLLIKNTVQFISKVMQPFPEGQFEIQAVTVKTDAGFIDIMNIYNPRTILSKIEFCHYLNQLRNKYIIIGDMNAHHSLWEPSKNGRSNQCGRILFDILNEDINRIALATPPDLHTYTNKITAEKSTIDLIMCDIALLPFITSNTKGCMGSDHMPISHTIAINADKSVRGKIRKWIFDEKKWDNWEGKLSDNLLLPGSIDQETKQFTSDIIKVSKEEFKQTSNKVVQKYNKPWWNMECSKTVAIRRRARRKMERTGTRRDIIAYNEAVAIATRTRLEAKRNSLQKYVSQINSDTPIKEVWDMMRKITGKHRISNRPIKYMDVYNYDKEGKALAFGKHYQRIMTKEDNREYLEEDINRIDLALQSGNQNDYNKRFTKREIQSAIDNLSSEKTYGKDEVHNQFLKHLPDNKKIELLGIFNRSWRNSIIPEEWKIAIIIPIPKPEKDLELPGSYRPISLLSCISK